MMRPSRNHTLVIIGSLFFAMFVYAALAQSYPNKPIRVIFPFPAGGPSDILGRALGQKLSEQLGANVVADNRPGAGGNLGNALVAKSQPDGYTILLTSTSMAIGASLYPHLDFDAAKDLMPIARLAAMQFVLVVHPSVPVKTLKQFVAFARAHPGKLNFGSGGAGTANHLANELLKNLENINLVHVPYRGATQAMLALIGGEIDEVVVAVVSGLPQIHSGKVRPLAVLSEQRVPALPDVPTAKEAGVDSFVVPNWFGMFAPMKTPRDIVMRLNREITKALETPDLRERLTASGIEPWPGTPEQLASLLRNDMALYAKVIKKAGLRVD